MLKKLELKLFSGYVLFAGMATIVDLGLLYLLTTFLGFHYLTSAFLSYFCGMMINYLLNKFFNFRNKSKKIIKQFGLFIIVALIGLALNQLILWSLVEYADLWYMFAKLISIGVVMFWSFYGHKKLTFKML